MLVLFKGGHGDQRRWIVCDNESCFRHVVEERKQLIELDLRNRIVLVVMALSARRSESHPGGERRIDSIDHVFRSIFFVDESGFIVGDMIAIESRRDALRRRWIW